MGSYQTMTPSTDFPDNLENSTVFVILPDEQVAILLWTFVLPVLLLLGTVGNILSVMVLTRKSMRRSYVPNLPTHLICLALSDLLVLYTGLLRQWIMYMFERDIRDIHPALCKINTWLVYFSLDMSAWTLVTVTVERAISVLSPYRVKVICTRRVHILTLCLIAVFLLAINSHFLFLYACDDDASKYSYFQEYVFPWIDLCLFCVGPFLFHIVGNTVIITRMMSGFRCISLLAMVTTEQMVGRQRQMSSMTTTLLCLNLVFLVCTLPISVFFIHVKYWEQDTSPEADAQRRLVYACVNLLMYLNNSTNFITYTLSLKRFREELWDMFCGRYEV